MHVRLLSQLHETPISALGACKRALAAQRPFLPLCKAATLPNKSQNCIAHLPSSIKPVSAKRCPQPVLFTLGLKAPAETELLAQALAALKVSQRQSAPFRQQRCLWLSPRLPPENRNRRRIYSLWGSRGRLSLLPGGLPPSELIKAVESLGEIGPAEER